MAHTHTCLRYHVVFSTARRRPLIQESQSADLYAYVGGIVRGMNGILLAIGGMPDHVHLLVSLPANLAPATAVQAVKANSSKWMRHERGEPDFGWQAGYSAFSVSVSAVPRVSAYIAGQAEHHRTYSFQQELIALLKKHGIAYDERFLVE